MPIRIVLADDHALFRQGLRSLLRQQPDLEVVAEVERASELLNTLAAVSCDLLLLDLQMERWMVNDIETLAGVTRVIVLTASERIEDGLAVLRLGARGVVQKRFAVETLMEAIHAVADGLVWMPATIQAELAAQLRSAPTVKLTARENEIVRCVALGMRNAEIAEQCQISEATVKTHINNIFQKLECRDRVELTRYAFRTGLLSPRE
ncbi:MAG: DNA-binding response regulator [Deltaproteobacteria bacterium]|nr:DNA-binding response regulator [Deltaproteobacteria bacterium]